MTARIEAGRVLVEGQFFDTPTGREVAQLFSEGAPWEMSVGIDAKLEPVEGDISANGQNFSSVRGAFRHGTLREVSFVPMGADPHTGVVAFAKPTQDNQPPTEGQKMTEIDELKQRLTNVERREMQSRIATKVGLPGAFASRIQGETEDDMETDAKALLAARPPQVAPKLPPTNPGNPQTSESDADRRKRLGL
jgi:hypothetical protein